MLRSIVILAFVLAVGCSSDGEAPTATVEERSPTPTPSATSSPALADCRYAFPLEPASAGRYVSSHHDYPATDILAPVGTRVVSVVDGVVDFVSRTDEWRSASNDPALRGGLSVAIVGDDGIRYYASHLRDVAEGLTVGDRVEAGQPIGHVGTSGNARGTDAHVHFGISEPTRPDDWEVRRGQVSPFVYLNAWRDGNDLTPAVPGAGTPRCRRVQS